MNSTQPSLTQDFGLTDISKGIVELCASFDLTSTVGFERTKSFYDQLDLGQLYQLLKRLYAVETLVKNSSQLLETSCRTAKNANKNVRLPPNLDEVRRQLQSHGRNVKGQQASVLRHIKDRSRPHLRPLHILDLPDEILVDICEYVRDMKFCYPAKITSRGWCRDTSNIMNLRRTCWKLCNTSSHLLIKNIQVDPSDPRSLAKFEEISHHPTIRKGIREVGVNLDFYDPELATDFLAFTNYSMEKLELQTDFAHVWVEDDDIDELCRKEIRKNIKRVNRVLKSWRRVARGRPVDPTRVEEPMHRSMLRTAHMQYQFRCDLQERLWENGWFLQMFAAAVARMPLAKTLEIRDHTYRNLQRPGTTYYWEPGKAAVWKAIAKNLILPLKWREAREYALGPPPTQMIAETLVAIHKAGVSLTELKISISPPQDFSGMVLSDTKRQELSASVQSLRHICVAMASNGQFGRPFSNREPGEFTDLQNFITTLIDTGNLETIGLDLSFLENDTIEPERFFSVGPIINSRLWPKLVSLDLVHTTLHPEELEEFVRRLNPQLRSLDMDCVRLLSGKWADVLDILRDGAGYAKIQAPLGGELNVLSKQVKEDIFGPEGTDPEENKARGYTLGLIEKNPFRDLQTEESSDVE